MAFFLALASSTREANGPSALATNQPSKTSHCTSFSDSQELETH